MDLDHARWMEMALDEARLGAARGEVPVGAVVVCGDQVVAQDHNRTRETADPTAHAEIRVLREAAAKLGDWRLVGCTLYVTLEPCAMCAGAIVLARIERLVFAADDPKAGMCGSLGNLVQDERLNHRVTVESGVLAEESGELLREFFREKR
ncbi:MAG: tRNA-specific adenosine deaminase [Gemmatimonadetes bacterium]|nr:tRNA-specific adenosine deaminase [Gemmatimonadota bacterium]NIO31517.1 tRNA-specific adenosine deaminase [Gemmatimonadota bacterium]